MNPDTVLAHEAETELDRRFVTAWPGAIMLLVEDELSVAAAMAAWLMHQGWVVRLAHTMADAESRAGDPDLKLAILDLKLADSEGVEVVKRFRSAAPHLPLIVLTGLGPDYERMCREAGAHKYFEKPVKLRTLRDAIEDILGLHEAASKLFQPIREAVDRAQGILTESQQKRRAP